MKSKYRGYIDERRHYAREINISDYYNLNKANFLLKNFSFRIF